MAVTNEQLDALRPTGVQDADWGKARDAITKLYSNDINGLVNNRDALKAEKEKLQEKYSTLETTLKAKDAELTGAAAKAAETLKASEKTWQDKVAGLEAELKKSQPDAIKIVYEARLAAMKAQRDANDKSLADATVAHEKMPANMKAENEKILAALDKAALERECETDLRKR